VFNIFNEAHFSNPSGSFSPATTTTYGQITSTVGNDSRVIQMGVKFAF